MAEGHRLPCCLTPSFVTLCESSSLASGCAPGEGAAGEEGWHPPGTPGFSSCADDMRVPQRWPLQPQPVSNRRVCLVCETEPQALAARTMAGRMMLGGYKQHQAKLRESARARDEETPNGAAVPVGWLELREGFTA